MKNVIDFHLFWFHSNLRRNRFIELSSELGAPILDRGQQNFRFWYFSIRWFFCRRLVSFWYIPCYPKWFSNFWTCDLYYRSLPTIIQALLQSLKQKGWESPKIFSLPLHVTLVLHDLPNNCLSHALTLWKIELKWRLSEMTNHIANPVHRKWKTFAKFFWRIKVSRDRGNQITVDTRRIKTLYFISM